jgi:hypothetical protein
MAYPRQQEREHGTGGKCFGQEKRQAPLEHRRPGAPERNQSDVPGEGMRARARAPQQHQHRDGDARRERGALDATDELGSHGPRPCCREREPKGKQEGRPVAERTQPGERAADQPPEGVNGLQRAHEREDGPCDAGMEGCERIPRREYGPEERQHGPHPRRAASCGGTVDARRGSHERDAGSESTEDGDGIRAVPGRRQHQR